MTLNVFRYPSCRSRLMIRNLDDARSFIEQCKVVFVLRLDRVGRYLSIENGSVTINQRLNDWVSFEEDFADGEAAVKLLYKYRKYINRHFSN